MLGALGAGAAHHSASTLGGERRLKGAQPGKNTLYDQHQVQEGGVRGAGTVEEQGKRSSWPEGAGGDTVWVPTAKVPIFFASTIMPTLPYPDQAWPMPC